MPYLPAGMVRQCRLLLVLIPFTATLALAQFETATVSGQVSDPSGLTVSGAQVNLIDIDRGTSVNVSTNSSGLYRFASVHPGRYRMEVRAAGFRLINVTGLTVNVQDHLEQNFKLTVGSVSESVTVEAAATEVSGSVGTVVDRQFAENLPLNGRSFQSLIELSPGIVVTSSTIYDPGQFSVNGQRSSANYVTVDGVSANVGIQPATSLGQGGAGSVAGFGVSGSTNSLVSEDALQEFRIQTSTFAPEFGRTPGGQVSVVTRSGTNQFHGALFEFLRNDKLDANDWFANLKGLARPEERINDFGGVFGGPIAKDHTFFFLSYEGQRMRLPQTGLTTVPSLSERQAASSAIQPFLNAYPMPNGPEILDSSGNPTGQAEFNSSFSDPSSLNATSIRVDHTIANHFTLFGRYAYAPSDALQRGSGASLNTLNRIRLNTQTLTLGGAQLLTPSLNNDFRFNYSRNRAVSIEHLDMFGAAAIPPDSSLFPSPFTSADGAYTFYIFSLQGPSWNLGSSGDNLQRQFNVVDNLSVQRGSHTLKFGIDYRRLTPAFEPPSYVLNVFFDDVPSVVSGLPSFVFVTANRGGTALFRNLGSFAQDAWKITPRLFVVYGLRWDVDFPPSAISGPSLLAATGFDDLNTLSLAPSGTPVFKTRYNNFAPRIGTAYMVQQTTGWETVLRGGFGFFYDLATVQIGDAYTFGTYPFGVRKRIFSGLTFPLDPSITQPPAISVDSLQTSSLFVAIDPHLRLPRIIQWNGTVEQSLGKDQSLSVAYVAAVGRRLLQPEVVFLPNSNFFAAELMRNSGRSDYHSFQAQFRRRLSRGLQALASYTLGHSIDTGSSSSIGSASNSFADALSSRANRGPSDFDVRHTFSGAVTYTVPAPRFNRVAHAMFRDWLVDTILQVRSAVPVDVVNSNFVFGAGTGFDIAAVRPDAVSGIPLYLSGPQYPGGKALNNTAGAVAGGCSDGSQSIGPFCPPPVDPNTGLPARQGNIGRNALRGFGATQWDFAARREFVLHESLRLQFRAEFFNVLNHPNFASPVSDLANSDFGKSVNVLSRGLSENSPGDGSFASIFQLGGPRSIQFGLKLLF